MKKSITHIAAALSVAICFAGYTGSASAKDHSKPHHPPLTEELLISFNEYFTGPTTIDGTSVLSGIFSDKGARHQDNETLSVSSDRTRAEVRGTVTITGAKGVLNTFYQGTIRIDPATGLANVQGLEYITGGTGIYANASGSGDFEATIDFSNGNIVGVAELQVFKR